MKTIVGHCPYCTKVLYKNANFKDEADFETNCHHCGQPIIVYVEKKLVVVIKPRIKIQLTNLTNTDGGV